MSVAKRMLLRLVAAEAAADVVHRHTASAHANTRGAILTASDVSRAVHINEPSGRVSWQRMILLASRAQRAVADVAAHLHAPGHLRTTAVVAVQDVVRISARAAEAGEVESGCRVAANGIADHRRAVLCADADSDRRSLLRAGVVVRGVAAHRAARAHGDPGAAV